MASNEQTVTLLRRNKRAQVEALNTLGYNLAESARAADFPMLCKWAAGLLDVTVALTRIRDNKKFFLTVDEWQSLSNSEQSMFVLRGVRVRACAQSFIIAADTLSPRAFSPLVTIEDTHNPVTRRDLYRWWDAYNETKRIADFCNGRSGNNVTGAPAAEAALNYVAYTEAADGIADDSQWCLPTIAHMQIVFHHKEQINAVFTAVWGSDYTLKTENFWCCNCLSDANNTYRYDFSSGVNYYRNRANETGSIRPICLN